jgi:hypothetical protein
MESSHWWCFPRPQLALGSHEGHRAGTTRLHQSGNPRRCAGSPPTNLLSAQASRGARSARPPAAPARWTPHPLPRAPAHAHLYRQGHTVRHAELVPAVPQRLPSLVTPLEQLPRAFSPPASLARGIRAPAALLFRARMRAPADRLSRRCCFALVVRTCASPPRALSKVPGASATVSWPLWLHRLWECLMAFPCTSHLAVMAP